MTAQLVPLPSASQLDDALGSFVDELITPALVIDLDAVRANARAIIERFGAASRWRPHLKTCKQAVIIEALVDAFLVGRYALLEVVRQGAGSCVIRACSLHGNEALCAHPAGL